MACFAIIFTSLLGPAIELGKCAVAPVKRHLNYLCCFERNIQSLRDEAERLTNARFGLQMQIDAAKRNAEVIFPEVEFWLTSANEIQVYIRGIENDIHKVQKYHSFLRMKSRYSLSKKVKKTIESLKKLRDGCKFNPLSQPPLLSSMGSIPFGQAYEFESRKQIEEDIMTTLRDNKVSMMGICGMGGVGKTCMTKRIINRAREEHLFDEVVTVVVSKQVDMLRIQHEIAELLGLMLDVKSLQARASRLHNRLTDKKRILVVLDDVWGRLELENLGIPCGSKGCTIVLTSRDRDVLRAMNVQKIREIQILPEEEAWFLFREKAGTCVDDVDLFSIAKDVAKECKGLPIALVTVGRALKDQKSIPVWTDALDQLRRSNPVDMPNVIKEVYNPLKLSYDFLDNQNARSLFLLCSLFPEDHNIPLEYLTFYSMGLRIFEGIRNLKEARNRACALVEMLKSRFLLLDGRDEHHVKMQDVIRDVAIFTASEEGRVNLSSTGWPREHSNCSWISVILKERTHECPMGLAFPNLRLLLIDNSDEIEFQMSDNFFREMKELKVLFLKSISFRSLPETIQLLKNLRTLHLDSCTMTTISIVGQLSNLEILCCRSCYWILEIPVELGRLNRLRLLEFSDCWLLETINPGIISKLVQLEELKMRGSFKKWDAMTLRELESLSNLTCLEIEILDYTVAAEQIYLSSKIAKYDIRIYGKWPKDVSTHEKKMFLHLGRDITSLGYWIRDLVRSTEFLDLTGDGSNCLNLTEVKRVKSFGLSDCSTVKKLVNTTSVVFPFLQSLWLCRVPNLEEICDGPIPVGSISFGNLKELTFDCLPSLRHLWKSPNQNISLSNLCSIHIWTCDNLLYLFSLSMARGLSQLEMLEIRDCQMMVEIFSNDNEKDGENHITFPRLKRLSLGDLPRLTTFCKGIGRIEFPWLTYMEIHKCPKLTILVSSSGNINQNSAGDHDDDSFHFFCNQRVAFDSLKELHIHSYKDISNTWCHQIPIDFFSGLEKLEINSCESIKSLFSSSTAANLVNLKELTIQRCLKMAKVIEDEENVRERSPFPSLELLELKDLPKLASFCKWRCVLELPLLKHVVIGDCPRMKSLTLGPLITPILDSIKIDNKVIVMEDLNGAKQRSDQTSTSAEKTEMAAVQKKAAAKNRSGKQEKGKMEKAKADTSTNIETTMLRNFVKNAVSRKKKSTVGSSSSAFTTTKPIPWPPNQIPNLGDNGPTGHAAPSKDIENTVSTAFGLALNQTDGTEELSFDFLQADNLTDEALKDQFASHLSKLFMLSATLLSRWSSGAAPSSEVLECLKKQENEVEHLSAQVSQLLEQKQGVEQELARLCQENYKLDAQLVEVLGNHQREMDEAKKEWYEKGRT